MKQAAVKNYEAVTVNEFKVKNEVIQFPKQITNPLYKLKEPF